MNATLTGRVSAPGTDGETRFRADVRELARRHRALLRRRAPWDAAWQSLADHFLPTRCRLRPTDNDAEQGPMLNSRLVDATGILAMRILAAGLQGGPYSYYRQFAPPAQGRTCPPPAFVALPRYW